MPKVFNSSVANMKREVHTYWLERRTNKTNLRREEKGGKSAKKKL
jgi:hypothetical protein